MPGLTPSGLQCLTEVSPEQLGRYRPCDLFRVLIEAVGEASQGTAGATTTRLVPDLPTGPSIQGTGHGRACQLQCEDKCTS